MMISIIYHGQLVIFYKNPAVKINHPGTRTKAWDSIQYSLCGKPQKYAQEEIKYANHKHSTIIYSKKCLNYHQQGGERWCKNLIHYFYHLIQYLRLQF